MVEAPAFSPLPRIGDSIGGKYIVESVLGQGAMGVVYEARHAVTDKIVAIKVLLPHVSQSRDVARRFIQEARASARIEHHNIVDTYDVGEFGGLPYLVMERLLGESLDAYLRLKGPLSLADTMALLGPVCSAVHAAHRAGVIHRDLKPENIFLCHDHESPNVTPKVLDFGVSKIEDGAQQNVTATGHAIGTALYMPFEQMIGARDVTPASDVYALGVILYECLTRTFPYEAASIPELAVKMANQRPIELAERRPDLPKGFCAVVMKALAKDVEHRFKDVPSLVAALVPFGMRRRESGSDSHSGEIARLSRSAEEASRLTDSGLVTLRSADARLGVETRPLAELPISAIRRSVELPPEPSIPPSVNAATETQPARRPARRSHATAFAALALTAVLFGAGMAVVARKNASPEVPTAPAAPSVAAAPSFARISIRADGRPNASVRIDTEPKGRLDATGTIAMAIPPGEHFVELLVDDLVVASQSVTVERGEVRALTFESAPAPLETASVTDEPATDVGSAHVPRAPRTGAPSTATTSETTTATSSGARRSIRVQGEFGSNPY